MKFTELLFLWTVIFVAPMPLVALSIGSNTAPSRQSTVNFLASDSDNTMLGFAAFENGFNLQTATTTCTYNDYFPVSGNVNLRGGALYLKKDLLFDKSLNITSSGSFFAASNSITFGKLIPDLSLSTSLIFDSATLVFNTGARFNAPLRFRNSCKINGQGKRLTLQGNSEIIVVPGGNLVIENAELWQIKKNNLRCLTDRGAITLRNCTLVLSQDYTFSRGSFLVDDSLIVTGTNKFVYTTGLTSTIGSSSTLFLDFGITFSYQPRVAKKNLISMTDSTAYLYLNGCTLYSTRTGLQLSMGTLIIDDKVTFTSEARSTSEAMIISSNLTARVKGQATVELFGLIRYD